MPIIQCTEFKPAWWLPGPHLQTIWPTLTTHIWPNARLKLRRERFELFDGDFLDLDWVGQGKGPLVMILHGLGGCIDSHYARPLLDAIHALGWRGLFVHFRGCSGEPNRLARGYHSGCTEDIDYLVKTLFDRESNLRLAIVGFSLGGNVLLKWLGETSANNRLQAAVAVSVPFDLHKAVHSIQGFSKLYEWYLLRILREGVKRKIDKKMLPMINHDLTKIASFIDFDNFFTAPLHGFKDAEDYYKKCSSRIYLKDIRVPTLAIHAVDDPFMTPEVIPNENELSSDLTLELTQEGGHVGFVSSDTLGRPHYWLLERIPRFLKDFLQP